MKINHIATAAASLLLLVPMLAQAQVSGDVPPAVGSFPCARLTHDLTYRSTDALTGGEVSQLQDFLQSRGYLNSEPTGYFGLLTQAAVKKFQTASGILSYGYVGPITREKIQVASCGGGTSAPSAPISSNGCFPGYLYSATTGQRCEPVPATPATPGSCVIKNFTATPSTVTAGTSITLSWATQNCGLVALNAGQQHPEGIYGEINGQVLSPSGTMVVYPKTYTPAATYTMKYALSAVGKAGDGSKAVEKIVTVTILPESKTPSPTNINVLYPTEDLKFTAGQSMRISWQAVVSANAKYHVSVMNNTVNFSVGTFSPAEAHCSASDKCYVNWTPDPTWFATLPVTVSVYDSVSRSSGTSASFMLNGPTSPSCTLTTNKSSYQLGEEVTFSWTSKNATYATFKQFNDGKDHQYVAGDKLDVSGTYSTPTNVYGNPTVTLLIYNYSSVSSCSTTFAVE